MELRLPAKEDKGQKVANRLALNFDERNAFLY